VYLRNQGGGGKGRGGRKGGEMTQTLYAHMNKRNLKKQKIKEIIVVLYLCSDVDTNTLVS
jgi:hypothetical protein